MQLQSWNWIDSSAQSRAQHKFPTSSEYVLDDGRIMRKGTMLCKMQFFNLSPFQGHKSPRLPTLFVGSLRLLLPRSNIRSYSKPRVLNGELQNSGIKRQFSNMIDSCVCPVQTRSGQGTEFLAVAGWCENHHTKVEVCSCYTFQVISVLRWKIRKCVILSLLISCHNIRVSRKIQAGLRGGGGSKGSFVSLNIHRAP